MPPGKPLICYKISRTFSGPGKSLKLKFKVLESPGILLWFKLTNMPCV